MKTLLVSVGIAIFFAHFEVAVGQEFLNLQESPPSSGLLSAQKDSAYTGTGINNGVTWLVNAEAGDRATFAVTTTAFANSYPRIRVSTSSGVSLAEVGGSPEGQVTLQRFQFQSPGVFKVNVFSNNSASAFSLQALLGRAVALELEDNNLAALASDVSNISQAGGFAAAAAGILDRDEDWHDLGTLDPGSSINFSLDVPTESTLTTAGTELVLFKDADTTPLATATGTSQTYPVTQSGHY